MASLAFLPTGAILCRDVKRSNICRRAFAGGHCVRGAVNGLHEILDMAAREMEARPITVTPLERQRDQKVGLVKLTMTGTFLPYKRY
jgi:hypothetical protein